MYVYGISVCMYVCAHKVQEGECPPPPPKEVKVATSTLEETGMATSTLKKMGIAISTLKDY